MKDIQILFFDIDGTLVNPRTAQISEKTKETLNRLRTSGRSEEHTSELQSR